MPELVMLTIVSLILKWLNGKTSMLLTCQFPPTSISSWQHATSLLAGAQSLTLDPIPTANVSSIFAETMGWSYSMEGYQVTPMEIRRTSNMAIISESASLTIVSPLPPSPSLHPAPPPLPPTLPSLTLTLYLSNLVGVSLITPPSWLLSHFLCHLT